MRAKHGGWAHKEERMRESRGTEERRDEVEGDAVRDCRLRVRRARMSDGAEEFFFGIHGDF